MAITEISRDWGTNPSIVRITTTDNLATITTSGYLTAQNANIVALNNGTWEWVEGDLIAINFSNGEGFFTRDTANATFVAETDPGSLSETLLDGRIFVGSAANLATGVAMSGDATIINTGALTIANSAINNAKVAAGAAIAFSKLAALPSAQLLVGSAGNVATAAALTGDATISNTGVLSLIAGIPRTISVDVTAAEFNGAYAAPHLILAAPAAGTYYVVHGVQFEFDYGGAQFANGGVMGIQYDNTANGAGVLTHTGVAAAVVQGVAADFIIGAAGFNIAALVGGAASAIVAKGLYLSNKTAAFDTGTSDVRVHLTYSTVTTSL